jgi:signal transduction histidine kinase
MIFGHSISLLLFLQLVFNYFYIDCENKLANEPTANASKFITNNLIEKYLYKELDTLSQIEKYLPYMNAENIFKQGKNLIFEEGVKNLFPLEWNIRNLSFSSKFVFFQLVQGDDFNDSREICFSKYKISKNNLILYDLVRLEKNLFKHTIYQFYRISDAEFFANSFMLMYRIKISEDGIRYSVKERSLTNPYSADGLQVVQPSNMQYNEDRLVIASSKSLFLYSLGADKIQDVTDFLISHKYVINDRKLKFTVLNVNNDDFVIVYQENYAFRIRVKGDSFELTPINIAKFKQIPENDNFEFIIDYSSKGMLELWRKDGVIISLNIDNQNIFSFRKFNIPFDAYRFLEINSKLQLIYSTDALFIRKSAKINDIPKLQAKKDMSDNFDKGETVSLGYTYGIAIGDIDNDEKEEILCVEPSGDNKLLKYNFSTGSYIEAKGRFPDNLSATVLNDIAGKFVDINNDGHTDLVLSTMDYGGGLFLNNGKGYFRDVTSEYGLDSIFNRCESIAIADFNNDGWVDLFVSNFYGTNRLLINKMGTKFEDATLNYGLLSSGNSIHTAVGDINNDGWVDLYVIGWNTPDKLYINKQGSSFLEVTSQYGIKRDTTLLGNSVLFSDFNNDTYTDIFLSYRGTASKLYLNQRGLGFYEASELLEENLPSTTYGTVAADFNNDSRIDIAITGSDNTNIYYNELDSVNQYGFRFLKKSLNSSKSTINPLRGYGTGLGVLDSDSDGDLDIMVGQFKGLSILYGNLSSENNEDRSRIVKVKVHPSRTNCNLLGVKIWGINKDSVYYFREIGSGEGYCSQISTLLTVPLLPGYTDCKIKVYFPVSGDTVYADIKKNESLDIYENSNFWDEFRKLIYLNISLISRTDIIIKMLIVFVLSLICFWFVDFDLKNYKFFIKEYHLSLLQSIALVGVAFILAQTVVELTKSDNRTNTYWRDNIISLSDNYIFPILLTAGLTLTYLKVKDNLSWRKITHKPDFTKLKRQLYMFNHGEGRKSNLSSIALLLANVRFFVSNGEITNKLMIDLLSEKLLEFRHLTISAIEEILLTLSFLRSSHSAPLNYKDFQMLNRVSKAINHSAKELSTLISIKATDKIVLESNIMSGLISKLLSILSKINIKFTAFTKISLINFLSEIAESYNKNKSIGINVILEIPKKDIQLFTDSIKLKECIDNIVRNSIESFYDSKNLIKNIILRVDDIGEELVIIINDNGTGIPKSKMKDLFLKGFSTKGNNRGMGLSYVREILIELGGEIEIISEETQGTEVKIIMKKYKLEM